MNEVEIDLLKNHPETIDRLAEIWKSSLGKNSATSLEYVKTKLQTHLNSNLLPLTFVALKQQEPIGMCSLLSNDGILKELSPWLAALVVDKNYQTLGIGSQLIKKTLEKAKELHFDKVYLFCDNHKLEEYYKKFGFVFLKTSKHKEKLVYVLFKSL